ncbi:MAG TPA: YciI family protein [Opitutaceae bacterium]|nr:YciI family protein [Opitutaceae bacterium]
MQFMLMVYKDREIFARMPDAEKARISEACDAWRDELTRSGHMRQMSRLTGTGTAATVRRTGDQFLVTDGPFAETKEVFGGFAVVECRDRDEAIELAKKFPGIAFGGSMEVRPIATGEAGRQC